MQRVWWDVEVNDAARSDPAWFETGLLAPEDWRGDWIEAEDALAAADRAADVRWMWSDTALDPRPHAFRLDRSEEHTSELQSLMRHPYAVFCLKKKKKKP